LMLLMIQLTTLIVVEQAHPIQALLLLLPLHGIMDILW
jgi:hypothetical protein